MRSLRLDAGVAYERLVARVFVLHVPHETIWRAVRRRLGALADEERAQRSLAEFACDVAVQLLDDAKKSEIYLIFLLIKKPIFG